MTFSPEYVAGLVEDGRRSRTFVRSPEHQSVEDAQEWARRHGLTGLRLFAGPLGEVRGSGEVEEVSRG
jgi:hypothetical protein